MCGDTIRAYPLAEIQRLTEAMYVAILLNWITYVVALVSMRTFSSAATIATADIAITGLLLFVALSVAQKTPRFQQAFGALCGASAVLNLVALPVFWLNSGEQPPSFGLFDLLLLGPAK